MSTRYGSTLCYQERRYGCVSLTHTSRINEDGRVDQEIDTDDDRCERMDDTFMDGQGMVHGKRMFEMLASSLVEERITSAFREKVHCFRTVK